MIICPKKYEKKIKEIINFGQSESKKLIKSPGFNGKISEYDCAILLSSLNNLKEIKNKLKKNIKLLTQNLKSTNVILQKNLGDKWITNKINIYSKKYRKKYLHKFLTKNGITSYYPWTGRLLHKHPFFKKYCKNSNRFKNSNYISQRLISIPFNIDFTEKIIKRITKSINSLN